MTLRLRAAILDRLTATHKGAARIMAGTVLGQLVVLAAAPMLARLYSPADFGLFAVLSSLVAILASVLSGRLEQAVGLPAQDDDAVALTVVAIVFTAATTTLATLGLFVAARPTADLFGQPQLARWLPYVPVIAGVTAVAIALNQLAARRRQFGLVATRYFLQSACTAAVQVACGLKGLNAGGLVFGLGAGQLGGIVSFARAAKGRPLRMRRLQLAMLSRYRRYPLVLAPSGLLNVLGTQLTVLLFGFWYGDQVAGWLGLSQRLIALPVAFVGTAIGQVYTSELGRCLRSEPTAARGLFLKTSKGLGVAGLGFAVIVAGLAPMAFAGLLGDAWLTSGRYAQALAIAMAAQLVVAPVSQTLGLLERQPLQLVWDAGRVLVVTATVSVSALSNRSALTAIWLFSAVSVVMYAIMWMLSIRALNARHREGASEARDVSNSESVAEAMTAGHPRRTP
jgi:O-antigen/teichoic acid export membrane protein